MCTLFNPSMWFACAYVINGLNSLRVNVTARLLFPGWNLAIYYGLEGPDLFKDAFRHPYTTH